MTFDLIAPPAGDTYRGLIDLLCSVATHFSLIIRPTLSLDDHARKVLSRLAVDLEDSKTTNQWPGTMLLDGHARINTYIFTNRSAAALRDEANSLYEWKQPTLPEDPIFYRPKQTPVLVTISHERDAFIIADNDEMLLWRSRLPGLQVRSGRDCE